MQRNPHFLAPSPLSGEEGRDCFKGSLPSWERGFEPSATFLASLLPLWEKGLRDEGARFCQSTSPFTLGEGEWLRTSCTLPFAWRSSNDGFGGRGGEAPLPGDNAPTAPLTNTLS